MWPQIRESRVLFLGSSSLEFDALISTAGKNLKNSPINGNNLIIKYSMTFRLNSLQLCTRAAPGI